MRVLSLGLAVFCLSAAAGCRTPVAQTDAGEASRGTTDTGETPQASSTGGASGSDDPSGASTGAELLTGGGSGSSSTGLPAARHDVPASDPPRPPPSGFVDVTRAAGLDVSPGPAPASPDCVLDLATTPKVGGDFCFPELFLGAAAVADFDQDGWLDVFLTRRDGADRLFRNLGDGTFEDVAAAAGLELSVVSSAAAWVDADNDGDLDLMLTAIGTHRYFLHINDGAGHFEEQALERGAAVSSEHIHVGMGIGVGDYNLDGALDLFVTDWRPDKEIGDAADHNRLLRGSAQVPGTFEDVTASLPLDLPGLAPVVDAKAGVYGFAPAFVDLDADGWPELALTADFGTSRLLWNNGGTLTDQTWGSGVGTERNGMGSTFGDYDGDGDLDWFVSAIWTDDFPDLGHRLYRNEGDRMFVDVADTHEIRDAGWGWGASWWDYDLDGDLDLAMAAGWPTLGYGFDPLQIWENTGPGPWPERSIDLGVDMIGDGRGLVPFDFDNDGDEDLLVVGNLGSPRLFRNDVSEGHWLVVRVRGLDTNSQGIGARIEVVADARAPVAVRVLQGDTQLMGQRPVRAHFGLGDAQSVAEVRVHFPVSGVTRVLTDVDVDQVIVIDEAQSAGP